MKYGLAFDGFAPASRANELAQKAEQAGIRSVWFAEHLGYREAIVSCTAIAINCRNTTVIPLAVSPYLWHPTPTAMALATLAELAPGRVGIAVGSGNPMFLEESGKKVSRPVVAVSEFVDCLRALWTGEPVHKEGEFFTLQGARCTVIPSEPIPIYIAAMGPLMLKLTGKKADGLAISACLSPSYIELTIDRMHAGARSKGRDPAEIKTSAYVMMCVSEDAAKAREIVREKLAFAFRNKYAKESIEYAGLEIDTDGIMQAISDRDLRAAAAFVPDEAVELLSVAGDVSYCKRRLAEYFDLGLDEVVALPMGDEPEQNDAIELIKAIQAPGTDP